jgi:hypothetical protein
LIRIYSRLAGDMVRNMVSRLIALLLVTFGLALPAHATGWLRAESEHYVVHAELSEARLTALMQTIEEFDRVLHGLMPGETRHGRKPEFYLSSDASRIAHVIDFGATAVCQDHAELPVTKAWFDPFALSRMREADIFYCMTQYHLGNAFFRPKPMWLAGGLSHFFATAYRNEKKVFVIGAPGSPRMRRVRVTPTALENALRVTVRHRSESEYARFLDISRMIAAPLLLEEEYAGMLDRYLNAYVTGRTIEDAARELGDPATLAAQLDRPASTGPTRWVQIEPDVVAKIAVRPMTRDEVALVELRIERLLETRLKPTASALRRLTGRFPASAPVFYEYAAAEYARVQHSDFGGRPVFRGLGFSNGELIVMANPYSDAEAWRAVNRALAIDPAHRQAQRLKAEIMLSRLVRAGELAGADEYDAVRALLAPLARDPEREPLAAALYFQSYIEEGRTPPEAAFRQLEQAFLTNSGVGDLRYAYATALSRRGDKGKARGLLISMLNDPVFQGVAWRALEATE